MNLPSAFYAKNRISLLENSGLDVIILAAHASVQRANDAAYTFEQESNFLYVTGIVAAGWTVVIQKGKTTLIAPEIDAVHEIFDGSLSAAEAIEISGADEVVTKREGAVLTKALVSQYKKVGTLGRDPHADHYDFELNPGPVNLLESLNETFGEVHNVRPDLTRLRAIKQPKEIERIRAAIDRTVLAFTDVKNKFQEYSAEYEIEADFSYNFRMNGATGHAYDPIIASGKNACTLHYGKNKDALASGHFVLLDVGARLDGYAADITRTYAYGEVSDRHKAVHAAVEHAHKNIIALLKPGLDIKEYSDKVDEIMKQALQGLGLLGAPSDYRKYFPHAVSHGLGIDVHDSLGGPEVFAPGMVLTVEPGIYIPEEGIGVRIEDDILITENGNENLSGHLSTGL